MRIIRGKYGRRRFDVPTNITARPTTDFARENIFNVIENIVDIEGKRVLDLFAGTGAVSFEFLSRGAAQVTAVEKAATQYNFIRKVGALLGTGDELKVIRGDVFRFLASASLHKSAERGSSCVYDIVFADPPYDMERFSDVPGLILESGIVGEGSIVIVEHSGKYDFSGLPGFMERRVYGSVNFSIFKV